MTPENPGRDRSHRRAAAVRALLVLACGLVPWTVVPSPGATTYVFAVGLVTPDPLHLTPVWDYLFRYTAGLPGYLTAWPLSAGLYLVGLLSALGGLAGWEDRRLTAGLLVLAGALQVSVAWGLSRGVGRTALPVGTVVLWGVAAWVYWSRPSARGLATRD